MCIEFDGVREKEEGGWRKQELLRSFALACCGCLVRSVRKFRKFSASVLSSSHVTIFLARQVQASKTCEMVFNKHVFRKYAYGAGAIDAWKRLLLNP
jgi:hypothetical protein